MEAAQEHQGVPCAPCEAARVAAVLYARGTGRYDQEYADLWRQFVPQSGQADTVQGELLRAIGRLASEFYRNGNLNWDEGFRAFADFLQWQLRDVSSFDEGAICAMEEDLAEIRRYGEDEVELSIEECEDAFDRVTDRVVEWCRAHPEPVPRPFDPTLRR